MTHPQIDPTPSTGARVRWPLIVVGLLATHVFAMLLAVKIATAGGGHTIVPDYYQKALAWDEMREDARTAAEMGWSVAVTPSVLTDEAGLREVRIVLHDRYGEPIEGASVAANTWHRAVGEARTFDAAAAAEPGVYVGRAPMERAGTWELEVVATRGEDRFVHATVLDVASLLEAGAAGQ
ncbi:MAG: FixH family protein [Planctomycetota bacterium]